MKTKTVKRYWCDFCKKTGLRRDAMEKHELHCTMNPNRKCRMCSHMEEEPQKVADLVVLLPIPKIDEFGFASKETIAAANEILPVLREKTHDCPACILAALRQAKIPAPATSFDYKKEVAAFWASCNNDDHY